MNPGALGALVVALAAHGALAFPKFYPDYRVFALVRLNYPSAYFLYVV
jgi:hypothetical protein